MTATLTWSATTTAPPLTRRGRSRETIGFLIPEEYERRVVEFFDTALGR